MADGDRVGVESLVKRVPCPGRVGVVGDDGVVALNPHTEMTTVPRAARIHAKGFGQWRPDREEPAPGPPVFAALVGALEDFEAVFSVVEGVVVLGKIPAVHRPESRRPLHVGRVFHVAGHFGADADRLVLSPNPDLLGISAGRLPVGVTLADGDDPHRRHFAVRVDKSRTPDRVPVFGQVEPDRVAVYLAHTLALERVVQGRQKRREAVVVGDALKDDLAELEDVNDRALVDSRPDKRRVLPRPRVPRPAAEPDSRACWMDYGLVAGRGDDLTPRTAEGVAQDRVMHRDRHRRVGRCHDEPELCGRAVCEPLRRHAEHRVGVDGGRVAARVLVGPLVGHAVRAEVVHPVPAVFRRRAGRPVLLDARFVGADQDGLAVAPDQVDGARVDVRCVPVRRDLVGERGPQERGDGETGKLQVDGDVARERPGRCDHDVRARRKAPIVRRPKARTARVVGVRSKGRDLVGLPPADPEPSKPRAAECVQEGPVAVVGQRFADNVVARPRRAAETRVIEPLLTRRHPVGETPDR